MMPARSSDYFRRAVKTNLYLATMGIPNIIYGKSYVVSSTDGCTVTDEKGIVLCIQEAGMQALFVAPTGGVLFSNPDVIVTPAPYGNAVALNVGSSRSSSSGGDVGGSVEGTLPSFTAMRALQSDGRGNISASAVTSTELGFLDGVTSNIQAQIDTKADNSDLTDHADNTAMHVSADERSAWHNKQTAITGGASSITTNNLPASRALISNSNGKVTASDVTDTELGCLDGVTSNIQAQLDCKQNTILGKANAVMITDSSGNPAISGTVTVTELNKLDGLTATTTELNYLIGATGNIQEQLNALGAGDETGSAEAILPTFTASRVLQTDTDGIISVSDVTVKELAYLTGITENIQEQLNTKANNTDISSHADNKTVHVTANERSAWNSKQAAITGGASSILLSNMPVSRALVSNSNGKVATSSVTSTELEYLAGATSNIQEQLDTLAENERQPVVMPTYAPLCALISDSSGNIAAASVTATELGNLVGVTENIQTQLNTKVTSSAMTDHSNNTTVHVTDNERASWNSKQTAITGGASSILTNDLLETRALVSDNNGKVAVSPVSSTELGYLAGVTGNIQTQLDALEDAIDNDASMPSLISDRALTSDSSGNITVSEVTSTELGYLDGVTSNIQTQLNNRITTSAISKGQNGYVKLSNGIIIQWGSLSSSNTSLTFPMAFSNTNYSINFFTVITNQNNPNHHTWHSMCATKKTTGISNVRVGESGVEGTTSNNYAHNWIAIGY